MRQKLFACLNPCFLQTCELDLHSYQRVSNSIILEKIYSQLIVWLFRWWAWLTPKSLICFTSPATNKLLPVVQLCCALRSTQQEGSAVIMRAINFAPSLLLFECRSSLQDPGRNMWNGALRHTSRGLGTTQRLVIWLLDLILWRTGPRLGKHFQKDCLPSQVFRQFLKLYVVL